MPAPKYNLDNTEPYVIPNQDVKAKDVAATKGYNLDNTEPYTIPAPDAGFWPTIGRAVQHGMAENPLFYGAAVQGDIEAGREPSLSWKEWQAQGNIPGEVPATGMAGLVSAPVRTLTTAFPFSLYPPAAAAMTAGSVASEGARQLGAPKIAQEAAGLVAGGVAGGPVRALQMSPGVISNLVQHRLGHWVSGSLGAYLGHRMSPGIGEFIGFGLGPPVANALVGGLRRVAPYVPSALIGGAAGIPSDIWNENELTGPPRAQ